MTTRVVLAGHNLDREILLDLKRLLAELLEAGSAEALEAVRERARRLLAADNWTPETLAAAYARVSRDPRSLAELRAIARAEVDRARRSAESIIFGLGHSSVAEHAVMNLDLTGISRLAVEVIESQRLVSYTEKSQRYILLAEDWVLPEEIRGTSAEPIYRETVAAQHAFYRRAYEALLPLVQAAHAEEIAAAESDGKRKTLLRTLEGRAKEDARYALGLSTTVQLGETINARNLERLIARCRSHPLIELRTLGDELAETVGALAPSLVKYTDPTAYDREARPALAQAARELGAGGDEAGVREGAGQPGSDGQVAGRRTEKAGRTSPVPDERGGQSGVIPGPSGADSSNRAGAASASAEAVRLVSTTPDPDGTLIAALLFAAGVGSMEECLARRDSLGAGERLRLGQSHLRHLGPHDPLLREYEQVDLVFDLVVSASCFAQLKRHRMASMTPLRYDPALGVTVPDSFVEAGLTAEFQDLVARSEECYRKVKAAVESGETGGSTSTSTGGAGYHTGADPAVKGPDSHYHAGPADYALTNAHRRRVLFKCNAREMHHLSRLREDAHAQWDIRRVASRMIELARERMPLTLLLAAGKDRFEERRREALPEG